MKHEERLCAIIDRLEKLVVRMEDIPTSKEASRETRFRQALMETITTLEETKKSFHSKQLKNLRERVESALNEE